MVFSTSKNLGANLRTVEVKLPRTATRAPGGDFSERAPES